jgi:hypothetical protein
MEASVSEELENEQLALLDNLLYSPLFSYKSSAHKYSDLTIGDIIELTDPFIYDNIGSMQSEEDWRVLIDAVRDDPCLSSLTLQSLNNDRTSGAPMAYFTDRTGEGYVIFCGTGTYEWGYDCEGAFTSDTPNKVALLRWFDSLGIDPRKPITVSGHSDGGNDAMYLTVRRGNLVKHCLALDSQQFSEEFCKEYAALIPQAREKITAINSVNDFVSAIALENIAGKMIFVDNGLSSVPPAGHVDCTGWMKDTSLQRGSLGLVSRVSSIR